MGEPEDCAACSLSYTSQCRERRSDVGVIVAISSDRVSEAVDDYAPQTLGGDECFEYPQSSGNRQGRRYCLPLSFLSSTSPSITT